MELTSYMIAVGCLIFAIVIYLGKGDWLIAGYNTASQEQREKYNIKRVRIVVSVLMVLAALFVFSMLYIPVHLTGIATLVFVSVTLVGVVLANTWAKK
ncbi:MAG: DUF3784 domain-containing protein [Bacteroidaceae bacterium]|nr:DUF3784 domain-containing protein [Bacteroidaceae bacterium]